MKNLFFLFLVFGQCLQVLSQPFDTEQIEPHYIFKQDSTGTWERYEYTKKIRLVSPGGISFTEQELAKLCADDAVQKSIEITRNGWLVLQCKFNPLENPWFQIGYKLRTQSYKLQSNTIVTDGSPYDHTDISKKGSLPVLLMVFVIICCLFGLCVMTKRQKLTKLSASYGILLAVAALTAYLPVPSWWVGVISAAIATLTITWFLFKDMANKDNVFPITLFLSLLLCGTTGLISDGKGWFLLFIGAWCALFLFTGWILRRTTSS